MYQMKKITAALLFITILLSLSIPAGAQSGVSETVNVKAGEKIRTVDGADPRAAVMLESEAAHD